MQLAANTYLEAVCMQALAMVMEFMEYVATVPTTTTNVDDQRR